MTKPIYKVIICLVCLVLLTCSIYAQTAETVYKEKPAAQTVARKTNSTKAQTVTSILEEMDKRMNKNCIQTVEMDVFEDNKMSNYTCTIKSKDNNQYVIIRYLSPDRWKDTNILMIKQDVIIYDSKSDCFLEVPKNLAFGGTDVAHGDMMRLNISKNYDGEIVKEDKDTWTIKLITINKKMPYYGIEIVINKTGYYPVTAKCFSKSNKHIKTIEYTDLKELNGIMKPTKYTFLSPYEEGKYNIIKIIDEKLIDYPDSIFNKFAMQAGMDKQ